MLPKRSLLLYSPRTDTFLEDMTKMPTEYSISTRGQELRRSLFRKLIQKRRRARQPWRLGHMIKLPWKREARPLEPRLMLNPRLAELETAKEVLAEIFHARPSEIEVVRQNGKN